MYYRILNRKCNLNVDQRRINNNYLIRNYRKCNLNVDQRRINNNSLIRNPLSNIKQKM